MNTEVLLVCQEFFDQSNLLIVQVDNQAAQRSYDADNNGQGDAIQLRHRRRMFDRSSSRAILSFEVGLSAGSLFCIVEALSNVAMIDLSITTTYAGLTEF